MVARGEVEKEGRGKWERESGKWGSGEERREEKTKFKTRTAIQSLSICPLA